VCASSGYQASFWSWPLPDTHDQPPHETRATTTDIYRPTHFGFSLAFLLFLPSLPPTTPQTQVSSLFLLLVAFVVLHGREGGEAAAAGTPLSPTPAVGGVAASGGWTAAAAAAAAAAEVHPNALRASSGLGKKEENIDKGDDEAEGGGEDQKRKEGLDSLKWTPTPAAELRRQRGRIEPASEGQYHQAASQLCSRSSRPSNRPARARGGGRPPPLPPPSHPPSPL